MHALNFYAWNKTLKMCFEVDKLVDVIYIFQDIYFQSVCD